MLKNILVFGGLAGAIAIALMTINVSMGIESLAVGYLILFAALSLIFVAIKRYRDLDLGGVIRFGTAAKLGLGIAIVAGGVYVIGWELYLWSTDYAFFDQYIAAEMAKKRGEGVSPAELARLSAEMATLGQQYNTQPLMRIGYTLAEVLPVGVLVALVSAGLLRKREFLPAQFRGKKA